MPHSCCSPSLSVAKGAGNFNSTVCPDDCRWRVTSVNDHIHGMRRIKYDHCMCVLHSVFKRSRKVRAGCMRNRSLLVCL